jgi:hypothetical protein
LHRKFSLIALILAAVGLAGRLSTPVHAQQMPAGGGATSAPRTIVIASGARLADIRGLAVDAAGNVYFSSEVSPAPSSCISRGTAAHISVTVFSNCSAAPSEDPSGVTVNRDGSRVFLGNRRQNSIRLLNMLTGKVALIPQPQSNAGQGGNGLVQDASLTLLAQPAGLALDHSGNLYVADRGNNRVLALGSAANDFVNLAHVLDAATVALDPTSQKLFIASPASNRIYQMDLPSGDIAVFAGTGALPDAQSNSSASQFPAPLLATQVGISAPEGVAVDATGNVFIADTGSNAILRVDAKTNLLLRLALDSSLNSPGSLAIDRQGNLFVADRGNHRVLEFAGVAAPAASGGVTLAPSPFNFGNQPTGGSTPQQAFVLTNNSSSALTLATNNFSFSGSDPNDFMQTNNCIPSLAAGSSCQISVTFQPQGLGGRSAALMVTDSDPSSPQSSSLTGTGDDFELTAANQNATMQTVVPGSPGNYSLSVTPDNVFGGNVALTCPTKLPDATLTCSINPPQLTITPGQASSFSVTITTTNGTTTSTIGPFDLPRGSYPDRPLLLGFAFLGFLLLIARFGLEHKNHRAAGIYLTGSGFRRRRIAWAASALAIALVMIAGGCGGSSSPTNPVTPAGIYKIDILGTAQNASRAITLTLNVE